MEFCNGAMLPGNVNLHDTYSSCRLAGTLVSGKSEAKCGYPAGRRLVAGGG